ncbi:MAG TPA: hypothetical protein VGH20_03875, partial [Myxococcales bacterium]
MGSLFALALLAAANVTDIAVGNALTLPSARHVVRIDTKDGRPPTWLLAMQQDGADAHWLSFYRSNDEAQTWSYYAPIQDTSTDRDEADIALAGNDVAMVYSYEGPDIFGSTAHDVYFQWWRYDGAGNWGPTAPVRVFDSASSTTAYLRAMIAIDSLNHIWIWAQRLNADGTFTMVMSVSTDGGNSFVAQPALDTFADRPGGRIMPVGGGRVMLLYSTHGVDPGFMRLRNDTDPLGTWGARQAVFPEGIYHGAALSAVDDGSGGVQLVYKDVNEDLLYRHWANGAWSASQLIDNSEDWAMQPALTRVGTDLVLFWNHMLATNTNYHFQYRTISNGVLGPTVLLDGTSGFKGYPAAVAVLPNTVPAVPCFYGDTPDANSSGFAALVTAPTPNSAPPPPPPPPGPDAGTPAPDAGTPAPDAGTPDAGAPPPTSGTLFSDAFARTVASDLGPAWNIDSGHWHVDLRANSTDTANDQASVLGLSCAECSVQAQLVNFAAATAALDLRQQLNGDRYDVALLPTGHLQIRRHNGATTTVLADVASGIADLTDYSLIGLGASGSGPVQLVATVNGATKLTFNDTSASAVGRAGTAGIATNVAGVFFKNFVVTGTGAASGADAGTPPPPDAGTPPPPDAGTPPPPDAGTPPPPDAGTPPPPDAGTPPTPDAGSPPPPDAGTPPPPDAGTPPPPDAGTPPPTTGTLFSDAFARNVASGLGSSWNIDSGAWFVDQRANSELTAADQASVIGLTCADCTVQAQLVNFAAATAALDLRQQPSGNRYDVALLSTGRLQIRRHTGATTTVLGDVASGIADLGGFSTIALTASGSTLSAAVDGTTKLTVTDASTSAIAAPGTAGIATDVAGVWFKNFQVTGTGTGPGGSPPPPAPDAGPPPAPPDAGAPPPDAGTPAPDAGTPAPDAGTPAPDAGTPAPDAGTPAPDAGTPPSGILFTDNFARTASTLGPSWTVQSGAFIDDNRANSDLDTLDRATVTGITCADCRIDARTVNFAAGESMLELRGTATDHYALALMANGNVQIRRYHGTTATILGTAASGLADLTVYNTISFTAQGSSPVTLTAAVNGVEKLSATDAAAAQLVAPGSAGIAATVSGILFQSFTLTGVGTGAPPPPPPPPPDAGTPDAGSPPPDAGTPPVGTKLTLQTTFTGTGFDLQAVDPSGTAYGVPIGGDNSQIYASTDGRAWTLRGSHPLGSSFFNMTALADGTLLADVSAGTHFMSRSTDHGATWKDVLNLGQFRTLTPHSWAQLGGTVYFLEYQVFTSGSTPIRVWASTDGGATWAVRATFQGHRHGHGLLADNARGVLWAWFGDTDPQCAVLRSTDGGFTWTQILGAQPADIVDGTLLPDGSVLAGQDISFLPDEPHVAKITATGVVTNLVQLPAASYSTHAISGGGYVAGVTREVDNDVTPAGVTNGSLWGSADGVSWSQMLTV